MEDTYFNTRLSYEPERDAIWKIVAEYLGRYIPQNAAILELGAGYCSFINQVKGREKHALDRSDIVRKYAAEDVKTHVCDCGNLKRFSENKFDVVFSSFLYEHLTREKLNHVLNQVQHILKPGGILLTLLPNFKYIARHYFDDYTHIQIFSHLSFSDYLVSRGFQVTDVQGRFLPFSFKSRLPKWPILTRIYLALPFRPLAGNMLVVAVNPTEKEKHVEKSKPEKTVEKSRPEKRVKAVEKEIPETKLESSLESQLPESGVRHGRRSRRKPVEHYGVSLPEVKEEQVDLERISTFEVKHDTSHKGPINPTEVRTRKKKK